MVGVRGMLVVVMVVGADDDKSKGHRKMGGTMDGKQDGVNAASCRSEKPYTLFGCKSFYFP